MNTTTSSAYNYKVVRQFAIMTVIWGIVGMAVGILIAAQLVWPVLNFDLPWTSYGRLRPLHTNAVIFCVRWLRAVCNVLLCGTTHLSNAVVCAKTSGFYLLGLAVSYFTGCNQFTAGLYLVQRICRT